MNILIQLVQWFDNSQRNYITKKITFSIDNSIAARPKKILNVFLLCNLNINKNDNIHKNEVQDIRWTDNIDKYRLAANITEYHIISKLILQRINITNYCGSESR